MKKKSTKAKPRKSKSQPKALLSRQWQSESTLSQRAAGAPDPADCSPSATGGPPPDPCKNAGTPPASVQFDEIPTEVAYEEPIEGEGGQTGWISYPSFTFGAFCDSEAQVWTCRVTSASAQQFQIIGSAAFPVDDVAIAEAPDCAYLELMWHQLLANMGKIGVTGFIPKVGFIKAHEDVHRDHASASIRRHYPVLVSDIEAISLACKDYDDAGTALAAMQASIATAKNRFFDHFELDEENDRKHVPVDDFIAAQDAVGGPWLDALIAAMLAKGCRTP